MLGWAKSVDLARRSTVRHCNSESVFFSVKYKFPKKTRGSPHSSLLKMVWAGVLVTYLVIAVVTLWVHARCFIHVVAGFSEVKYRKLRFGRAKYGLMSPGSHFILPFIQKRIVFDNVPASVFPVLSGAGRALSTDKVFATTSEGDMNILVQAEFSYYIEDPATFVREEFTPFMLPDLVAYERARAILEKAVSMVRPIESAKVPFIITSVLEKVCADQNKDSALIVHIATLQRCAVVEEIPLGLDDKYAQRNRRE